MAALSPDVQALLRNGSFASLATLMPDGSPQSTVIWIDTDGEHIVFNTAEGRQKPRNLRRDPRVAISVVDKDNPYKQAWFRGRVVEMTTEGADAHIDLLAKRYLGVDSYPGRARKPEEVRLIVKVAVESVGTSSS
ncbi:MAG: PPOX class F420-dependent oxidoreductase [Chloroflexi bacterium]|nr:PPOX class F420-dependent oxidoreductase [Chloroflexota bacterium]